jgi:predicted nucleic acid-binding protein
LRAFPDLQLDAEDYERAAEFFNIARGRGIQGSNTDFLICAAAERRDMAIMTTDADFEQYRQHLPIRLHHPRSRASDDS